MNIFNTPTFHVLSNGLDASTLRQRVIADNIANVDTPQFKSREVSFEAQLREAIQNQRPGSFVGNRTHAKHLPIGFSPSVHEVKAELTSADRTWVQNNRNNVDVEYEMTKMAQNQIWYNALVQQTNGYFSKIREVIREGR